MIQRDTLDDYEAGLHRQIRRLDRHVQQLQAELEQSQAGNRILAERLRQVEARRTVAEAVPSTN